MIMLSAIEVERKLASGVVGGVTCDTMDADNESEYNRKNDGNSEIKEDNASNGSDEI